MSGDQKRLKKQGIYFLLFFGALLNLASCAKVSPECKSEEGRNAIIQLVDQSLSHQDCEAAIAAIEPHYNSPGCDTDPIREARASAYACAANVNFFSLINDLQNLNLTNGALWESLTGLFPSSSNDRRVTAAQFALDSLFAMRLEGQVYPPESVSHPGSIHPGALYANQRTYVANVYSMLVSMSLIGALQNRYGAPDASFQKTKALGRIPGNPDGWMKADFVDQYACTYAGSVLTLFDSISEIGTELAQSVGGSLGTALTTLSGTFSSALDVACDLGCQGAGGTLSGCSLPAGYCNPCPIQLRDRNSCTSAINDPASCAAAGLIYYINTSPIGWQGPL